MKKKSKRIISTALACMLLLGMLPASALAVETEKETHWSAEYVQSAQDKGWIDAGKDADQQLTRAQFAVILWKALGSPEAKGDCPFADVAAADKTAITALAEKGVVEGIGDSFEPDGTLTRQEGITMLARAFELKADNANAAADFADWTDVADWAQDAMAAMVDLGIVNGVGDNRLGPENEITLGEMAKLTVIAEAGTKTTLISADNAIKSVEVLGTVGMDGSKPYAIVVEYTVDLTGAEIDLDDFEINDYGTSLSANDLNMGSDPGKPLKVYVNDEAATSENGGTGTGKYVIVEVNTDYSVSRFPRSWKITMAADVKQLSVIKADQYTITPSTKAVVNYEEEVYIGYNPQTGQPRDPEYYNYALDGTYYIEDIADYELHTIGGETGHEAFHATNCFDEANGQYWDFDLPYALYVPDDYDSSKEYALVLHIHDAGSMSSDPRLTLTEAQGPANYASEEFQQLAKDQGLGGAIVVCPAIDEFFYMNEENPEYELRMARDNWTLSCGCPAIWQLMDSITENYNIDMNRIYGSGQSMGGMTVMAMAAQRDNYFAAILPMSCQWGQNFNKEYEFNGTVYYNAPTGDGELIWDKDVDGNPVDFNNWYYLCSDDNILFLWTDELPEFMLLYRDLCGVEVESANMYLDTETNMTDEERSALINELVNRESDLGMYYIYLNGTVGHMSAWFYGHGTTAVYEWMLSQTRESEMAREKLDLNKPFVLASEQLKDDDHVYSVDNKTGEVVYYPTGEFGSGTIGYNSACSALGSKEKLNPGWTPEN